MPRNPSHNEGIPVSSISSTIGRDRWWAIGVLTLLLAGLLAGFAHAQTLGKIIVTRVDSSQFPEVSIRFRALDDENSVVQDLTLEQVDLREGETTV